MNREIRKQRCFRIPKDKLDLFLVNLSMNNGDLVHFEAEYVFDNPNHYDVIVNRFGSYPYAENEIAKFAEKLNAGPEPESKCNCPGGRNQADGHDKDCPITIGFQPVAKDEK